MPAQIQPSRTELKFSINEEIAAGIKHYLGSRLRRDSHGLSHGALGYPVCSVYLDSDDASLYGQTVDGNRNRYKLRVRVYDDDSAAPAFAEIKRRDGQVIKKQRATVDRRRVVALLAGTHAGGSSPTVDSLAAGAKWSKADWLAMQEFCRLRDRIRAVGTTYVTYLRDAYVSPDGLDWRATFDRRLCAMPYRQGDPITIPPAPLQTPHYDTVVFELKFTDRFPQWMQDLVRVFNLRPVSFPKYVNCWNSLTAKAGPTKVQDLQRTDVLGQRSTEKLTGQLSR